MLIEEWDDSDRALKTFSPPFLPTCMKCGFICLWTIDRPYGMNQAIYFHYLESTDHLFHIKSCRELRKEDMALPAPGRQTHGYDGPNPNCFLKLMGIMLQQGQSSGEAAGEQAWSGTHNHLLCGPHGGLLRLRLSVLPDSGAFALAWLLEDQECQELRWRLTSASCLPLCTPAGHRTVITIISASSTRSLHFFFVCFVEEAGALPLHQSQFLPKKSVIPLPP